MVVTDVPVSLDKLFTEVLQATIKYDCVIYMQRVLLPAISGRSGAGTMVYKHAFGTS